MKIMRPTPAGTLRAPPANPIITAADCPYRANTVFNPGAPRSATRRCCSSRVEDLRGISHLTVARSADGVSDWRFDAEPLLAPDPTAPRGDLGLRGPAADVAAGARGVGDRLHGLQPARAAGLAGDDASDFRRSAGWAR